MSKSSGLQHRDVIVANTLVRSAQALSLAEKRMIFSAIAKMGNNFGETGDVILTAAEYAETFDLPIKQAYEQLKDAADNLFDRYFTLAVPDRKGKGSMKWKVRWVESSGYDAGSGRVGLTFTQTVKPYLCGLKKEFTKYRLKQACALRSIHAWRLLELFEQQSSGWLNISVDDFHNAFETTELQRANFGKLRTQVIEPAIWELAKKDDWLIGFDFTKLGRKVHMLKFTFEKNPQGSLFQS
jgi:plasmid replication initiation protein